MLQLQKDGGSEISSHITLHKSHSVCYSNARQVWKGFSLFRLVGGIHLEKLFLCLHDDCPPSPSPPPGNAAFSQARVTGTYVTCSSCGQSLDGVPPSPPPHGPGPRGWSTAQGGAETAGQKMRSSPNSSSWSDISHPPDPPERLP